MKNLRSRNAIKSRRRQPSERKVLLDISRALRQISDQIASDVVAERAVNKEYVEKTLHLTSLHYDLYAARSGRPYFPLNENWALTFLDTGEPFFVDTSDRDITPWVIMGGHWEPNVARSLMAYASQGMTVLDVGAHMGYYTVKLGKKVGASGRLLAFEPNPQMLPFVEENLKLNDLVPASQVLPIALGDEKGTGLLKFGRGALGRGSLIDHRDAPQSVGVSIQRIDDVVPPDWTVDLIKIDAEGYESKILAGARETLARSPDCAIMIEVRLEGWEQFGPVEELAHACGDGKTIFGIEETGAMTPLASQDIRSYLLARKRPTGFHENYFFAMPSELARARLPDFIAA